MAQRLLFERLQQRLSAQWVGLLVVVLTYFAAAGLTWRKWPDVLVDFGAQLYLPWRISAGSVLYRDVMYLTGGPLSQYYHAFLFKLFGVSLLTVVISNLAIGLGLVSLIYRRFLACSDAWTASAIGLGVVLVFAFNQFLNIGNYNFITPYCHEVWHGVALSIGAVALLSLWVEQGRMRFVAGAGFCAGLVFMTKPEVFAALLLAFAAAFVMVWTKKGKGAALAALGWALSAGLAPLIAFLLYFHRVEDWHSSARAVAFAWVPLLGSSVSKQYFYKWCLGLDAPGHHLRVLLIHTLVLGVVVGLCAAWFRRKIDTSAKRILTASLIALLAALASGVDWLDCGRALPVLTLALCAAALVNFQRSAPTGALAFPLLWGVLGLGLLAKLGLYSRVWHYGFVLAMPAFAGAIYLLLWLVPAQLEWHGVHRGLFRGTIGLLLMVGCLRLFVQSMFIYQGKTLPVGCGADTIMAFAERINPAGAATQAALDWMAKNAAPEATLAVLPEGALVNYLSRRINPAKYLVWNPAEIAGFGQSNMIASFRAHPPDYILLTHRDASEYGAKFFGQEEEFGLELRRWIEQAYEPVWLIGNEPLRDDSFGIKIFRKLALPATK